MRELPKANDDEARAFDGWLASNGLRFDVNVRRCMRTAWNVRAALCAAPAAPVDGKAGGVEYDRELIADMLHSLSDAQTSGELDGAGRYHPSAINEQADMLREVDNADAARVGTGRATRTGSSPTNQSPKGRAEALALLATWGDGHMTSTPEKTKRCAELRPRPTGNPVSPAPVAGVLWRRDCAPLRESCATRLDEWMTEVGGCLVWCSSSSRRP